MNKDKALWHEWRTMYNQSITMESTSKELATALSEKGRALVESAKEQI